MGKTDSGKMIGLDFFDMMQPTSLFASGLQLVGKKGDVPRE